MKIFFFIIIFLFTQISVAQFLFQQADSPKDSVQPIEPPVKNPLILRDRVTQIDTTELFNSATNQQTLILNLFVDTEIQAQVERSHTLTKGGSFISGSLEDGGQMILFINKDGIIRGEVHSSRGVYTIKSHVEDKQRVIIEEIDISKFPTGNDVIQFDLDNQNIWLKDSTTEDTGEMDEDTAQAEKQTHSTDTKIDVLVLYTNRAKNEEGGKAQIEAAIEMEVEKTNVVLSESTLDSNKQINLVAMKEISYTQDSSDMGIDLDRLSDAMNPETDPEGLLDEVFDLRDKYTADFVHLFVRDPTDETCGIAYVYNLSYENLLKLLCSIHQDPELCLTQQRKLHWEDLTFSVSSVQCATQYTFTHELGHSMGIFHDRFTVNQVNPLSTTYPENFPYKPYAFGYVNQLNRLLCERTIMAYRAQCIDLGASVTIKMPIFSNPNVNFTFYEDPAGRSGTQATTVIDGPANASKAIDETWSMLANLRHSIDSCDNAIFSNAPDTINISASGENKTITLVNTVNGCSIPPSLTTTSSDSFISSSVQKTSSGYEVDITVDENNSCSERIGNLTLTTPTTNNFTITIEQDAFKVCELITNNIGGTQPGDVTSLDLSKSNIVELRNFAFQGFTKLEELTLKQNQISTLPEDVFDNLIQLEELDLRQNQISTLPANVFSNLTELEDLNLSSNQVGSLPTNVFANLTQLEDLNLSGNQISSLSSSVFRNLRQLEDLDLSSNQISSLSSNVFSNLTELEDLNLSGNEITTLSNNVFRQLTQLKDLNLSGNQITTLNRSTLSPLSRLRYLWLNANTISTLTEDIFTDLSQLRSLGLDGNQINTLPDDLFDGLSKLRYLWLNTNNITTLPENIFEDLSRLRYLNLSSNNFSTLPANVCTFLRNLRYLVIKGTTIDNICPQSVSSSVLETLQMNFIKKLFTSFSSKDNTTAIEREIEYNKNVILKMQADGLPSSEISELTGYDESAVLQTIKTEFPFLKGK